MKLVGYKSWRRDVRVHTWQAVATVSLLVVAGFASVGRCRAGLLDGVDVSHYQGTIDWNVVGASGIEFAFVKATEGTDYVDPTFQFNMDSSLAAGVVSGPYHFARPDVGQSDPLDATNEALHFANTIRPYYESGGYLRPVIDLEVRPGGSTADDRAFLSQWIRDFAATVESEFGFSPLIYTNLNYATNYLEPDIAGLGLWIARWTYDTNDPPADLGIWNDWAFWQYSNQGSISGIAGRVDLDVFDDSQLSLSDFIAPAIVDNVVPGDGSGDGRITGVDYLIWAAHYGEDPALDPPGSPLNGDYNDDGRVDGLDYLVWAANYGQGPNDSVGVPEPSTLLGTSVLVICCLVRRRR